MLTRRNWVLRFSIVLNLVVLFYFGTHIASKNGGMDIIEELQQSGRELAAMEEEMAQEGGRRLNGVQSMPSAAALVVHTSPQQGTTSQSVSDKRQTRVSTTAASTTERKETSSGGSGGGGGSGTVSALPQSEATLQMLIPCHDRDALPFTGQRGDFWVLYNYVAAERRPHCWESITYTTHADYTFLDNLQPLLDRWRGPVSLALYAPGTDFAQTLNTIRYLKDCGSDLVNEFVTFHIYFPSKHIPKQIPRGDAILAEPGSTNCSLPAPWLNQTAGALYKTRKKLLYPVNVGRNIARESATTHFVLPSDIELYPSPGLIPEFLAMVLRQEPPLLRKNPKVFVLSIFELESNMHLPVNKNELVSMVRNGSAISFHKKVCPGCHNVPKSKEWLNTAPSSSARMRVFHIGKRTGYFVHWEPIFIGTNHDPFYDERLSWEGKSDKMTQGYTLCVLDYEFHILDSAFLVHKPGIKTLKKDPARAALSAKSNALISRVIFPELKVLYGTRRGCAV